MNMDIQVIVDVPMVEPLVLWSTLQNVDIETADVVTMLARALVDISEYYYGKEKLKAPLKHFDISKPITIKLLVRPVKRPGPILDSLWPSGTDRDL